MKKNTFNLLFWIFFLLGTYSTQAQITNWTGAVSTDWNDASNWDNGVPTITSSVVIPNSTTPIFYPILPSDLTIQDLTFDNSAPNASNVVANLDFNGFTLTISGNLIVENHISLASTSRNIGNNATGGVLIVSGGQIALDGFNTPINFYVDCDFKITVNNSFWRGNTFYRPLKLLKTNTFNDTSGGNIFKEDVEITQDAPGDWHWGHSYGGADVFEKNLRVTARRGRFGLGRNTTGNQFNTLEIYSVNRGGIDMRNGTVNGTAYFEMNDLKGEQGIQVAQFAGNTVTFKGEVTIRHINCNRDNLFRCSQRGTTIFEENVIIEGSGGTTGERYIDIGNNQNELTGKVILAEGKTISTGINGFSSGELRINKVKQTGGVFSHTHILTLTGAAQLGMQRDTLAGNLQVVGEEQVLFRQCQLGTNNTNTIDIECISSNPNLVTSCGGNVFKGVAYITNTGRGKWYWGHSAGGRDIFEAEAYFIANDNITPNPPSIRPTNYQTNYQTNFATNYNTSYNTSIGYIFPPYYVAGSGTWSGTKIGFPSYPRTDNLPTNTGDPDLDAANGLANETAVIANEADQTQSETNFNEAISNAIIARDQLAPAITNLSTAITEASVVLSAVASTPAYLGNEGNVITLYNDLQTSLTTANAYLPTANSLKTNVENAIADNSNTPGNDNLAANQAANSANLSHTYVNDLYNKINLLHQELNNLNAIFNATLSAPITDAYNTGVLAFAYNTIGNIFNEKAYFTAEDRGVIWGVYTGIGNVIFEKEVAFTNNSTGNANGSYRLAYAGVTSQMICKENAIFNQNGSGLMEIARDAQLILEKDLIVNNLNLDIGTVLMGVDGQSGSVLLYGEPIFNLQRGELNISNFNKINTNPFTIQNQTSSVFRISGNSTLNGEATFIQQSTGLFFISNTATSNVVFNANVHFSNQNSSRFDISNNGLTTFNGNIQIENTFSYTDANTIAVQFGRTNGQTILNDGFKIEVGTFQRGRLSLGNFQQKGTSQPQNILLIAPSAHAQAEFSSDKNTSFEAVTIIEANQVRLNATTFFEEATIRCYNQGESGGGNTFKKKATLEFKGNNNWILGFNNGDVFEDEVEFYNNGINSNMYIAYNSPNNRFDRKVTIRNGGDANCDFFVSELTNSDVTFLDDLEIINNASNGNIYFSKGGNSNFEGDVMLKNSNGNLFFGGNSTLSADKGLVWVKSTATFTVDVATPWQTGQLHLKNFRYDPTTPLNLNLYNGNDNQGIYIGPGSNFAGEVSASSARIFLNGATYNQNATFEKRGNGGDDQSFGGNVFNALTRLINNSTNNNEWYLATQKGDDFNADVIFTLPNTNSGFFIPAYSGKTTFAGNITINGNSDKAFDFSGTGRNPNFGMGTGSVIFDGTGTQSVSNQLTSPIELNFRELNIKQGNATSILTFDRNFTITHYAKFTLGKIVIGNRTLTIANSSDGNSIAVLNPNRSHVIATGLGTVNREVPNLNLNVIFPVGNSITYTPATLSQDASGTTDIFEVRILDNVYLQYDNESNDFAPIGANIAAHFTRRSWIITEQTSGGSNVDLILQWNANAPSDELPKFDRNLVSIVRYNNTTNTWSCTQPRGAAIGPPNTRRITNDLSFFGVFSVATVNAVAGPDQIVCIPGDITLAATSLDSPFSGEWSQISGPVATITNIFSPTSTVTGIQPSSTYVFRWTNKSLEGDCGADLWDEVTINVGNEGFLPSVTAVTWIGAQDSDWFNCANWTDFTIPNETVDVTIPDVSALPFAPVISASGPRAKNLTIQAGGNLTIAVNGDLSVEQNALIETGSVLTNEEFLLIKEDLTIQGTLNNFKQIEIRNNVVNLGALNANSTESVISVQQNFENQAFLNHTQGTFRFFGNKNTIILGTEIPTLFDVNIDKTLGRNVSLQQTTYISGTITFLVGLVNTSTSNLLVLNDDAQATSGNSNSYVNGAMRKIGDDAFVFPIGKNGRWARIAISSLLNTNVQDYFTAEYFPIGFGNYNVIGTLHHVSRLEYWTLSRGNLITGDNTGTTQPRVTLYWEDANWSQINYLGANDLVVAHFTNPAWENMGSIEAFSAGGLTGNVTSTMNINDFSPFTFGSQSGIGNPLPVILTKFSAEAMDNTQTKIDWTTSFEANTIRFEVERSLDGTQFQTILSVDATGNSQQFQHYQAFDKKPFQGVNYYRLKVVDLDGKLSYSKWVAVRFDNTGLVENFSIYPNPFVEKISIQYNAENNQIYQIRITDLMGREVYHKTIQGKKENTLEIIDLSKLANAPYLIEFLGRNQRVVKQVIKQR